MPDMSLMQFIGHVARFDARLDELQTRGMERVARIVENEARSVVGHYQDAVGPFAAWQELADSTKDDRVRQGFTENDPGLRTGEMRDSIQHVSDKENAVIGSDDDKLVWFELGTSKQPPRSVLGTAVIHKEEAIKAVLGSAVVKALVGPGVHGGALAIPDES